MALGRPADIEENTYEMVGPEDDINDTINWETVLTVTPPEDNPAGLYLLRAYGQSYVDSVSQDHEARLVDNNFTQLGQISKTEGKDSTGPGQAADGDTTGTDQNKRMIMEWHVRLDENDTTSSFSYQHRSTNPGVEIATFDLQLSIEWKRP